MMKESIYKFDQLLIQYVVSWPSWLHAPFTVISFIGQPIITIGICILLCIYSFSRSNSRLFLAGFVALTTMGIANIIKLSIGRDRPATEYATTMFIKSFSFPSGHTVGSTVVFGLLAYLAWKYLPQPWASIITIILVLIIVLVGLSRIYLGAHYPSDVIAGWIIGAIGLSIIIFAVRPTIWT